MNQAIQASTRTSIPSTQIHQRLPKKGDRYKSLFEAAWRYQLGQNKRCFQLLRRNSVRRRSHRGEVRLRLARFGRKKKQGRRAENIAKTLNAACGTHPHSQGGDEPRKRTYALPRRRYVP